MLFFEYYTKYDSSPTEHQVFTSPPTERSIYFVDHHVLPLSVFIFQEHSSVSELVLRGSPRPLQCLRTLSRPRSCSGTSLQTTLCSGTSRQTTPRSGTRQTTLRSGSSCQTTPCSGYIARPLRARDIYVHRIRVYACERHGHASKQGATVLCYRTMQPRKHICGIQGHASMECVYMYMSPFVA